MARIAGSHHVLGIKHLLRQFRYGQGPVLLASSGCQGSEPWHEEMETRERYHVYGKFTEISVQLTRESETRGDAGHGGRDKMV